MTLFNMPVSTYMTRGVHTITRSTSAEQAFEHLQEHRVSSVPVVDDEGRMLGVISRSDLLREGTVSTSGDGTCTLVLPEETAGEMMLGVVVKVSPQTSVHEAANTMTEQRIHRVYVEGDGRPTGVLSARDVMQAVVDKRVPTPISELMTTEVVTLSVNDPLSSATDALATGAMTGIIVVDDGWPAGVLTQEEALMARHRAPDTRLEHVMAPEVVTVPPHTPAHRAAAQALSMHVRRVVALDSKGIRGVLSSLDLVRLAADA